MFMKQEEPKLLKLDIQFFNDDKGGDDDPGGQGEPAKKDEVELPKTAEDLKKLLQSESDKRVTDALKTAQSKWEQEYSEKLANEKAEAEKLAGMSAAEKEKALLEKSKNDIADRERAIATRELKLETINILDEKKLPIVFADILLGDDAEKTKGNVDTFEKAFRGAVQDAVEERLKGKTPKGGTAVSSADNYGKKIAEATQGNKGLEEARKSYFE